MELLAAELPEDSRRNARVVKKRLGELGLLLTRAQRAASELENNNGGGETKDGGKEGEEGSPTKKAKLSHDDKEDMDVDATAGDDLESLEMDLERLLDAAMDSMPAEEAQPKKGSGSEEAQAKQKSTSSKQPAASTCSATMADSQGETQPDLDLENELAAILEESQNESNGLDMNAAPPAEASNVPPTTADATSPPAREKEVPTTGDDDLENQLDDLLNGDDNVLPSQAAPQLSQESTTLENELEAMLNDSCGTQAPGAGLASQLSQESTLEMALERIIDDALA